MDTEKRYFDRSTVAQYVGTVLFIVLLETHVVSRPVAFLARALDNLPMFLRGGIIELPHKVATRYSFRGISVSSGLSTDAIYINTVTWTGTAPSITATL